MELSKWIKYKSKNSIFHKYLNLNRYVNYFMLNTKENKQMKGISKN